MCIHFYHSFELTFHPNKGIAEHDVIVANKSTCQRMENYDCISFLGQGSYGEVQLVKHVLEGKEVSLTVY